MYDIILFDLDDTLLDFANSEHQSLQQLHEMYYQSITFNHFVMSFKNINTALWNRVGATDNGLMPTDVRLKRFEQLHETLNVDLCMHSVAEVYDAHLGKTAQWYPQVQAAIEHLHAKGHILGIVTNGLIQVQEDKYQMHNLGQWFDCYTVSDHVGVAKPHRDIFESALNDIAHKHGLLRENIQPHQVLMVGDSLSNDGVGAANAGIDFCYVNPEQKDTTQTDIAIKYNISTVAELPFCLGYQDLVYL